MTEQDSVNLNRYLLGSLLLFPVSYLVIAAKLLQRKVTTMWQVMPASQACGQWCQASLVRYGFAASEPAGRGSMVLLRSNHPSERGQGQARGAGKGPLLTLCSSKWVQRPLV